MLTKIFRKPSYTNSQSSFLSSKDNFKVFWQKWIPNGRIQRVVILQHGFGEHSDRYQNIIHTMLGTKTAFYALDARGHGRSDGIRGHVDQFQQFVDDLGDLVDLARSEYHKADVFVLGHSLGAVIASQYMLQGKNQEHLKGIIISSPAHEIELSMETQIKKFVATIGVFISPATTLDVSLNPNHLSRDPQVVEAYRLDPLVHGYMSFQLGLNLFSLAEAIYDKAHILNKPILIIHGTQDRITKVEGSRNLYQNITTFDKTLKLYEGYYHETMNEISPDKELVLSDIKEWLLAH